MANSTESDDLLQIIETAAAGPHRVIGDAGSVQQQQLTDLIAAHRYISTVLATKGDSRRGLRFTTLVPDGALGYPNRGDWSCR